MSAGCRIATKHLGLVPYGVALRLQQLLVERRIHQEFPSLTRSRQSLPNLPLRSSPIPNLLLLLQHPPTYTMGRRDWKQNRIAEREKLEQLGAAFYQTKRGGQITFHGPGQLVGYPIFFLKDFQLGLRQYIESVENALIKACREFGISAERTADTGVWVGDSKIAAMGVHVQKFVTSHGFALNCNTDLGWFAHIVPCGLVGKGVTSITDQCSRTHSHATQVITTTDTIPAIERAFSSTFNTEALVPLATMAPELDQEIDALVFSNHLSHKPV
ncbi:hypothetical protein H4R34_000719 [Dimargaris verticillata]|uniref:lipoyl(octanoyl) transferase n=1 Tax=Dimargaris verticillata TaxID=2761393 RepID=A0A9W8BC40_9FUNG|nr:hypothetical protein H4R34_000719 [Dimargaris verticillata]